MRKTDLRAFLKLISYRQLLLRFRHAFCRLDNSANICAATKSAVWDVA